MNASAPTVTASFAIPLHHPALPGHFPGNPVVPGVVILDRVIRMLAAAGISLPRLRKLRQVKFIEPLMPDQEVTVTAEIGNTSLSFSVTRGTHTIVKGTFEIGDESAR